MFCLKGRVEIKVIDALTKQVKQTITQDNIIPNNTLHRIFTDSTNYSLASVFSNNRISISTSIATPSLGVNSVPLIIATGYIPSGVTSPQLNIDTAPYWGRIQNRIDFVNTSRTFNTLALTALPSANIQNTSSVAQAYLLLDTPCTQGSTDFLDITYYIFAENLTGVGLIANSRYLQELLRALFNIDSVSIGGGNVMRQFNHGLLHIYFGNIPTSPYKNLAASYAIAGGFNINAGGWTSGSYLNTHFKYKHTINHDSNQVIGTIWNSLYQGFAANLDSAFTGKLLLTNQTNRVQNGFAKSTSATKPFFDSLEIATGKGKAIFTDNNWSEKYPSLYTIKIIAGGAVGVATYKIEKRLHLGFNGNVFTDLVMPCPYRNTQRSPADNFHGWQEGDEVLRWSNTAIVQYDLTGVTLLDIFNGDFKSWDATTTPSLGATNIRQCAVDPTNQLIYVGCRTTGIWIINVTANTISNPVTFPCYGVDVGRNNVAWALIEGALINSNNWGVPLSFNYTGISNSNWSKVQFLKIDPSSAADQLAMVMDVSPNYRVVWWSTASANGITGFEESQSVRNYPSSFDVSDIGGFWASARNSQSNPLNNGILRFTFGSNTTTFITNNQVTFKSINNLTYGNQLYRKIDFLNDLVFANNSLVNISGSVITTFSAIPANATFQLHLKGGICLSGNILQQLFSNTYARENYGWDGSDWIKDALGSKTTHASNDNLIDGLSIRFENGLETPHFVAGEFFNQYVNWGLLKDNATTLYYESGWYTKQVLFNQVVPGGLVVPSASPYTLQLPVALTAGFLTMEIDTPKYNQFTLNGVALANLYVGAGIPPGPNEIRMQGNGFLEFNAADAGKTLGGTYAYVKDP